MIDVKKEVLAAEKRIRPYIRETPLDYSFHLSEAADCRAFLKLENLQYTGSFKARGAVNKILALRPSERERGVIAASTGNHGLAVAYGLSKLGLSGTLFLPENTSPPKIEMLRQYNIDIRFYGNDCADTEAYAKTRARNKGQCYISPYNDIQVVGGQGTMALELLNQMASVDCIMASVGGGGLIGGIGGYAKAMGKDVEIIGCLPQNSPVMFESAKAGEIVDIETLPTLSDGTAGGIEPGSITFELCRQVVDDWVLVKEDEIGKGIKLVFEKHGHVIEGAAGVVVAAFIKMKERLSGKNVALVICGGNIDIQTFKGLIN
ncbi:MAG: threonine/serine dehydratase [Deltaproteobacteria bacterium]|nr:threonine/serine dehydratase [Deltaproteobacteria bacterium]